MTSRKSSGSKRAESAVEPTRSQNITVTCRRSATSRGFGSVVVVGPAGAGAAPASSADGREHFSPVPEQDTDFLESPDQSDGGVTATSIAFSAKRSAYSDMPRFSSHSAISRNAILPRRSSSEVPEPVSVRAYQCSVK